MPRRVRPVYRVPVHIAVPVKRSALAGVRYHGIRTQELPQLRIIEARLVVVKSRSVFLLRRILVLVGVRAAGLALDALSPWLVCGSIDFLPVTVRYHADASQMVRMVIVDSLHGQSRGINGITGFSRAGFSVSAVAIGACVNTDIILPLFTGITLPVFPTIAIQNYLIQP